MLRQTDDRTTSIREMNDKEQPWKNENVLKAEFPANRQGCYRSCNKINQKNSACAPLYRQPNEAEHERQQQA